jgi:hypothetical protein
VKELAYTARLRCAKMSLTPSGSLWAVTKSIQPSPLKSPAAIPLAPQVDSLSSRWNVSG